ncbi:uncharacterized protein SPPG_04009 [Spizellomyces punctatus DAOM BR117]|uniref:Uncharacterized protein n=1 Tax=Spizellomyces punctatus (strain DAOM BR117) TaxID=645134 RepID=A0A0L0HJ93_SPIPD|nr:uncharacterized protein SPPG_04009 [Spizellomyces punctatus DAOM BR117]KND00909.1 hypothetical protein SPPG_04009 [Spizellomyces punctatus DAOM BR117]|eukprot:XP_016608948.1 hypothetical protein SPPG_04009 [Spizellomyces punctatus DAOM BR117]
MTPPEIVSPSFILRGHTAPVLCLDLCSKATASKVASGAEDGTARVWDIATAKCVRGLRGLEENTEVSSVCFSGDDLLYVAAGHQVRLFDLRSPGLVLNQSTQIGVSAEDEINHIALNEKRTFLATADDSGHVTVTDLRTTRVFKRFRQRHENLATCVRFQPNRSWDVWSGGMDSTLIHWDFSKGCPVEQFPFATSEQSQSAQSVNPPFVHSLEFSPDARLLAAGLGDGSVALLNVSGKKNADAERSTRKGRSSSALKARLMDGHSWAVSAVTFPRCERGPLLSGGIDGNIVLWDIPASDGEGEGVIKRRLHIGRKTNCLTSAFCSARGSTEAAKDSTNQADESFLVFGGGTLLPGQRITDTGKRSEGDIDVFAVSWPGST